jgi:hypothetical protein
MQNKRESPTETIFDDSGLKGSEITGDIVKWLVYDSLEDKVMMTLDTHNFAVIVVVTFVVGSVSAVSSTVIKDIGSSIEQKKKYAILSYVLLTREIPRRLFLRKLLEMKSSPFSNQSCLSMPHRP